jgi:hypothetical protein
VGLFDSIEKGGDFRGNPLKEGRGLVNQLGQGNRGHV